MPKYAPATMRVEHHLRSDSAKGTGEDECCKIQISCQATEWNGTYELVDEKTE